MNRGEPSFPMQSTYSHPAAPTYQLPPQPPPPPLLPNTALFRTTLPRPLTWQQPADLNNRIPIMQSIQNLLSQSSLPIQAGGTALASLARKLETYLYIESASNAEYANLQSLPRRVQALTAAIVNRSIRKRARQVEPEPIPQTIVPILPYTNATGQKRPKTHQSSSLATLFSFTGGEIWHTFVWEFVGGLDTLRCRGINQQAAHQAPKFVRSLNMSCNVARQIFTTGSTALAQCIHLRELEIYSLAAGITFGRRSMFARHCSQRFVVTHDDHEQIVSLLARQLNMRCWPQLRRMSIICLFTNDQANGEADVLLSCLQRGVCPALTELSLPGNSFGDYGAIRVAELLQSGVCPNLSLLDLRRNFIGERGIQALALSLTQGSCQALTELCLGGNMLTDSSLAHLLVSMESQQVSQLQFLGLEMNYLTAQGIQDLGTSVGKLGCPRLTQISFAENSVDDVDAKKILNQAILIQRVKQKRARLENTQPRAAKIAV